MIFKNKLVIIAVISSILLIIFMKCPSFYLLGIPCAGCGMSRAYLSLLHGDIKTAFIMHPLFPIMPFIIIVLIFRKTRFGKIFFKLRYAVILFILFIITYIVRMIFMFPNISPMNYNYGSLLWQLFK